MVSPQLLRHMWLQDQVLSSLCSRGVEWGGGGVDLWTGPRG